MKENNLYLVELISDGVGYAAVTDTIERDEDLSAHFKDGDIISATYVCDSFDDMERKADIINAVLRKVGLYIGQYA